MHEGCTNLSAAWNIAIISSQLHSTGKKMNFFE